MKTGATKTQNEIMTNKEYNSTLKMRIIITVLMLRNRLNTDQSMRNKIKMKDLMLFSMKTIINKLLLKI